MPRDDIKPRRNFRDSKDKMVKSRIVKPASADGTVPAEVIEEVVVATPGPGDGQRPGHGGHGGHGRRDNRDRDRNRGGEPSEFVEKVVAIKRVTKVNKGGKKLSFSALVVVGDGKGKVGYNLDKAGEVAIAIKKSLLGAKKKMVTIPLKGSTIPHAIIGQCGGATVLLKPASDGTGVIAAGPVRAVCDGVGIRNILTKCHRSNNPVNVVKATFDGLMRLKAFTANPNPSTDSEQKV